MMVDSILSRRKEMRIREVDPTCIDRLPLSVMYSSSHEDQIRGNRDFDDDRFHRSFAPRIPSDPRGEFEDAFGKFVSVLRINASRLMKIFCKSLKPRSIALS